MNTAQAGNLVENFGAYNGRRFFRKHLYRFFHVLVAAAVSLHVEDARVWITRRDVSPETVRDIDHAQRHMRRLGDPGGGDVHAVFQAPGLFGLSKVQLNVAPQTILVHERRVRQGQVTAA